MRKIKQILQLHYESGLSRRTIVVTAGNSYGSVANYLNRAEEAGISWPLPDNLYERDLERLLFPSQEAKGKRRFTDPDFSQIQEDLKLKTTTKLLLWEEHRQAHPKDGYSYPQFCHRYKVWSQKQSYSMRQIHRAREKLFIDYCGPTIPVVNPDTGEFYGAQIVVAVLGASIYTFACASKTQNKAD